MNEQMTAENQVPATLVLQIEAMIAVGGLSPAQAGTFRQAADRIEELEAQNAELLKRVEALVDAVNDILPVCERMGVDTDELRDLEEFENVRLRYRRHASEC